ncbi:Coq4 family protein [Novosphingobium pentaromativorans]|uniref:Uncharacterized protein n=1 Tax=Novosphingobium pentaromativorans US6-1 TaxID=1088721 RepID=G6EAW5_9SPHN|nr:Coq4 family protein [Novosphingobium pentaromativorans]AIT80556.1 hypothetical protein JI59_12605 [Novosphingobium pentaromativorans US6-1]EHJ61752.1 hypothetical protein NSU_1513 [Novosphingobium pentaromativorans US6-1]
MATKAQDKSLPQDKAGANETRMQQKMGMTAEETAYMRGDKHPVAGSIPMSTSPYLNSPLFVHAFTRMALRRHGDDVAVTYDIPDMSRGLADVADYRTAMEGLEIEKASNPALADFLERRPRHEYRADDLQDYGAGTLGAAIRAFIDRTGYDLAFVNKGADDQNDLQYLIKRFGDCHDVQHIATGFHPNLAGELALSIMNVTCNAKHFNPKLAHFLSQPNIFVSSASYARTAFNYPEGTDVTLEAMERGIAAGRAINKPLILVEWENYLDWQLEDIARDLGFVMGPGHGWDFSNECCRG